MDTYGFVSVIGLAGVALLAYRAFMESKAGQTRAARARAVAVPPARAVPPRRRARRRRRRR